MIILHRRELAAQQRADRVDARLGRVVEQPGPQLAFSGVAPWRALPCGSSARRWISANVCSTPSWRCAAKSARSWERMRSRCSNFRSLESRPNHGHARNAMPATNTSAPSELCPMLRHPPPATRGRHRRADRHQRRTEGDPQSPCRSSAPCGPVLRGRRATRRPPRPPAPATRCGRRPSSPWCAPLTRPRPTRRGSPRCRSPRRVGAGRSVRRFRSSDNHNTP